MKILVVVIGIFFFLLQSSGNKIPSVTLKKLNGSSFNAEKISNNGKPILLCFWATWCRSSVKELDNIFEFYADWQKETGVKLVAVSFDDARSLAKVSTMVNTKGWDYEIYVDANSDLKRAMNVNICPHTFLIDNEGNIVWQATSYLQGSENEYIKLIRKLAIGEKID